MKKVVIFIALLTIPAFMFAQSEVIEKLFTKYAEEDGFTSVYITSHMFELFSEIETDDEDDFIETTKNLEGIKILHSDKPDDGMNFYKTVLGDLPTSDYKELMIVHEKDQDIKFLIKKNGKKISEFLMVAGGASGNTIISIYGEIDLKKISKLSRSMKINGMEKLEKVEDKDDDTDD